MKESLGYVVKIYFPDNRPDGLWIMEKSGWNGVVVQCPRSLLQEKKARQELGRAGVYMLLNSKQETIQKLYIGEADPLIERLSQHERTKDFWSKVVCFTAKDETLNKAHVQYLESRLLEIARQFKIVDLENSNKPTLPSVSESEKAEMEFFLSQIIQLAPILGIDAFEEPPTDYSGAEVWIKAKGVKARGYETAQGFLVKSGSEAVLQEAPSLSPSLKELRKALVERSVLTQTTDKYTFSQDYVFGAPSTAACVVLGASVNGRKEWKAANGKSLKELQEMCAVGKAEL